MTFAFPATFFVVEDVSVDVSQVQWERGAGSYMYPPPFLVLTRAGFWFRGQKCRNTGSPCLDRPLFPRGTHYATHVANITQLYSSKDDKGCPNRPTYTP